MPDQPEALDQDRPLELRGPATPERPDRYRVRGEERERCLICIEAPEIEVRIDGGEAVSEAAARKAPEGTIFVDGAARGAPFIDADRRILNLDHHEGCVRAFTASACEQALILVLKGFDLTSGAFRVQTSAPDLDAVLAIWVLLNSMHLTGDDALVRRRAIPLIRLESVIDAHGLELRELTGFSEETQERVQSALDAIRDREIELKKAGRWGSVDPYEYTVEALDQIDRFVYPAGHFVGLEPVEVLERFELTDDRIGIVCRAERGIYEVEQDLKRLYGRRLGLVVLEVDPGRYTLRQTDPFLPKSLDAVYRRLNVIDPAVGRGGSGNRWGGSAEIGGSPRSAGTGLSAREIAVACAGAYERPSLAQRSVRLLWGLSVAATGVVAGGLGAVIAGTPVESLAPADLATRPAMLAVSVVALVGWLLAVRERPHHYGLRWPTGREWWGLLPMGGLAGLAGGAWVSPGAWGAQSLVASLAFLVAAELLVRGTVHGLVARGFEMMHPGGPWFLSLPAALTALLSAGWIVAVLQPHPLILAGLSPSLGLAARGLAAVLAGLAAGAARERSGSVLGAIAVQLVAAAALFAA